MILILYNQTYANGAYVKEHIPLPSVFPLFKPKIVVFSYYESIQRRTVENAGNEIGSMKKLLVGNIIISISCTSL